MKQNHHIEVLMSKHSQTTCNLYRRWLTTSLDCIRLLLKRGFPIRGRDGLIESSNQENSLEMLRWFANRKKKVK